MLSGSRVAQDDEKALSRGRSYLEVDPRRGPETMRRLHEYKATFGEDRFATGAVLTKPDESAEDAVRRQISEEVGVVSNLEIEEIQTIMSEYMVRGERENGNDFKAPVVAESVEEAKEKFLESVGDEFTVTEVE